MFDKRYNKNERIRARELRVISATGENLGVISTQDALRMAREARMDLVEIVPTANPPVAKILDFNKFLYDERKKTSAAKAKSKAPDLKEFKFGPNIGANDLDKKIERAREFIKDGNRAKFTVVFMGRQNAFPQIGWEKINSVIKELSEVSQVEAPPRLISKMISVILLPK